MAPIGKPRRKVTIKPKRVREFPEPAPKREKTPKREKVLA